MIPYGRHSINDEDIAAVVAALKSDWLTTGPLVEQFENALEKVMGAPCITVSSGTAALHCAYAAIGLAPGDEVITPPITFIATQATAALFGATIVFADVQPDTANINPRAVEAAITPRTKVIVAVDYAGHPADLDELRVIADRFPTKNLTTGEGGAVASIHPELLERAKRFSRQGLVRNPIEFVIKDQGPWHQEVHEFGLNYRLPDILCALGISQLKRLEEFKAKKRGIFEGYKNEFQREPKIILPIEKPSIEANWHLYPIRVPESQRLSIFQNLRSQGIGVQVNYLPAHLHPVFSKAGGKHGKFLVSEKFYKQEISLPMHASLNSIQIEKVISTVLNSIS